MKHLFLHIAACLSVCVLSAQTAEVRTYGGLGDDVFEEMRETDDGGYLLAGTTASAMDADTDAWLVKLNEDLTLSWTASFGAGGVDQIKGMDMTPAQDAYLAGFTNETDNGDYDALVFKVDSNGDLLWEAHFGGPNWDFGADIITLEDGGFLLAVTSHQADGNTDILIVRGNADGMLLSETLIGDGFDQTAASLVLAAPDLVLLGGTWATDVTDASRRAYIAELDLNGAVLNSGLFGESETVLHEAILHQDAYLGVGWFWDEESASRDHCVFKTETDLTLDWMRTDGDPQDDAFHAVVSTDVGMLTAGTGNSYGAGGYAAQVQQRSHSGWWNNSVQFGGEDDEAAQDVLVDSQGRSLICGYSESYGIIGEQDGYLARIEGVEVVGDYELDEVHVDDEALSATDPDAQPWLWLQSNDGGLHITAPDGAVFEVHVYSTTGQLVEQQQARGTCFFHPGLLASGVYVVTVQSAGASWSKQWLH